MTPWSPFSGAPMDGEEIRVPHYKCYLCGKPIIKGSRAFRAPRAKKRYGPTHVTTGVYPTFGDGISLGVTYRHRECTPA